MVMQKKVSFIFNFSKLIECVRCGNGVGKQVFKSAILPGPYCSSNCYVEAMIEKMKE
jgi:hypothetical protein